MSGTDQILLECPACRAISLEISKAGVCCPSCGYSADGKNGAIDYVNAPVAGQPDRSKRAVHECPECKVETLVTAGSGHGQKAGSKTFICFTCGNRWKEDELQYCPECYRLRPITEFEELIVCRSSVGFYVCRNCYGKIFK